MLGGTEGGTSDDRFVGLVFSNEPVAWVPGLGERVGRSLYGSTITVPDMSTPPGPPWLAQKKS
jgi:hypothetical protein